MEKRNKLRLVLKVMVVILLLAGVSTVFVIGFVVDRTDEFGRTTNVYEEKMPYIEVSPLEEEIPLVGEVVLEWLKGETSAIDLYQAYSTHGRVYSSKSVLLHYSIFDIPDGETIVSQEIELSENSTFNDVKKYELGQNKRSIQFDNLYTGTMYYFRITVVLSDNTEVRANGQFKTADTPRIIMLEGPRNVRDIGGWKTVDGKTVKQGMFYRGSELDGAIATRYAATEADIQILHELGIKSEFDLRYYGTENVKDVLGENVNHNFYTFLAYNDCFTPRGEKPLRDIFKDLAVKENYPIYLHCSYGADRTGTMCFFLEAVLGLSDEELYKDWELTILCNGGAFYEEMDLFLKTFNTLEGDTTQEKAYNYLMSLGVTREELDSIREILLED